MTAIALSPAAALDGAGGHGHAGDGPAAVARRTGGPVRPVRHWARTRSPCSTGRPRCRRLAVPAPCPSRRALPLTPCPPDDRVQCPGPAAARLGAMLAGRHADLLREWLAGAPGRRPGRCRPSTSRSSSSGPEMTRIACRMVSAAAGPLLCVVVRGPARARMAETSGEPPEEAWERGTAAERVAPSGACGRPTRLRSARDWWPVVCPGSGRTFEPPATARWPSGSAPATRRLLEQALDDRGSAVREVAAALLATLPTSAWSGRMAQRARRMVHVPSAAPGQDQFDIALVAPLPPTWERDGIDASAPAGTSLGVHLLGQVVAGTPLAVWEDMSDAAASVGAGELSTSSARSSSPGGRRLPAASATGGWAPACWPTRPPTRCSSPSWRRTTSSRLALRSAVAGEVLTPMALATLEAMPPPWSPELSVHGRRGSRHVVPRAPGRPAPRAVAAPAGPGARPCDVGGGVRRPHPLGPTGARRRAAGRPGRPAPLPGSDAGGVGAMAMNRRR